MNGNQGQPVMHFQTSDQIIYPLTGKRKITPWTSTFIDKSRLSITSNQKAGMHQPHLHKILISPYHTHKESVHSPWIDELAGS